jgi:5'-phosphate synthase pdxT subunit
MNSPSAIPTATNSCSAKVSLKPEHLHAETFSLLYNQITGMPKTLTIGVLALQGAFEAHAKALTALGATAKLVRTPNELADLDGLIIPGGESTTFLKFLERDGFLDALESFVATTPTFGTCAGAILLAKNVENPTQKSLAALDITVERNAYGRQIDSAILSEPTRLGGGPLEMVFIRAPRITRTGANVETLATRDNFPVLVREGHILAATFHPELSADPRVHQLFLDLIRNRT